MGLDFTGPIKWSEIVAEFGQPSSSTTTTFYNVPWVNGLLKLHGLSHH